MRRVRKRLSSFPDEEGVLKPWVLARRRRSWPSRISDPRFNAGLENRLRKGGKVAVGKVSTSGRHGSTPVVEAQR